MSQSDTKRVFARIGSDGLAQIGPTRFDIVGARFDENPEPNERRTDPEDPGTDPEEPDPQGEDPDEDDGFDGEFDAPRARRTIDRLRKERNAAREKAAKASDDPERTKLQSENLRLRVALQTGLDIDLADRLRGSTEEELLEDAQKMLDRFYPAEQKPKARQPKPRLRGGSDPDDEPELSSDDVAKAALGR